MLLNIKFMKTIETYMKDMKGTELGDLLAKEVAEASSIRGGRDFKNIGVKSIAEMGDAAGIFHTASKEVNVREDVVCTRRGIAELVKTVLVHEDIHKGNSAVGDSENHNEGLVQWRTQRAIGKDDNVYDEEVTQIEQIAAEIGDAEVEKLGKEPEAEVLLFSAYVKSKIAKGSEIKTAAEEAANLIKKAA